ncbi:MerR family transcriptional regulator [Nonomuraea jabiensis]|uniref:MerR family transcriptional regulator n=1 Tax=Nonomuraea jabiensis TaxID=882448 RepID=UPI00344697AF
MTDAATRQDADLPWDTNAQPTGNPLQKLDPLANLKTKLYRVNGVPTPFYGIGELAKILGRRPDTIRGWEERGWLPKPTAVFPGRDPRNADSATHGRRRLYTRAHLLGLLKIAQEEDVLANHSRISQSRFPQKARKLFKDLADRERAEAQRKKQSV